MPGLATAAKAFATPGITSLLAKRPDVQARVARANMVSALRVQSGAKRRAPVDTGRMKQSISILKMDDAGLELNIGTNVVSLPPGVPRPRPGRKRPFKARPPKGGYRSRGGYHYPRRQEYDTRLRHTTGECGFLRKSLRDESAKHAEQCRKALVNGLKGYA